MTRLSRDRLGCPAPPVRSVHFGPGAFHRAHQAWYTGRADPSWGIAAVTARSDDMVGTLGGQDGLYTLVTRGPDADEATVVGSIAEVVGHADPRVVALLARPEVTVVTLTVTEAGYGARSPVLARLVAGLDARRRAGAGPIAVLSCDNMRGNGAVARDRVASLAAEASPGLAQWIAETCAFPDTVVDRITPATRPEDRATAAALTGWDDRAAVVTEPWTEWVIEDTFGPELRRPAWERFGARLVPDVGPWERRKLRLLNAGHSLLAYLGAPRGHRWVHEAVSDPVLHDALLALWGEARTVLPGGDATDLDGYCAGVEDRWSNARLPHALAQIGAGGLHKLQERIVPTLAASRADGAQPSSCALVLAAWAARLRSGGITDPGVDRAALMGDDPAVVARTVLGLLDGGGGLGLADDAWSVGAVAAALTRLERPAP